MIIGDLKALNSSDRDVLHSRNQSMISSMEFIRKLLLIPMAFGVIQVLIGLPGLLILIGIFPIIMGSVLIAASAWCRRRLAANIAIARTAYSQYVATLAPSIATGEALAVS